MGASMSPDWCRMITPKLSIIIPSYNQGRFIERTLLSILHQDPSIPVQIIVSDGGSTDETVSILKKFPEIEWWSERDRGFANAVNKGLAVAKGQVVGIQSSDDYYMPNIFERVIDEFERNSNLAMLSGYEIRIDTTGKNKRIQKATVEEALVQSPREMALMKRYLPQHCTFFLRSAVMEIGGLRENVDWCADFDLFYRMLHKFPCKMIDSYIGVYQEHEDQRTKQKAERWVDALIQTIRDANSHPHLGKLFALSETEYRSAKALFEMHWHRHAGGERGQIVAADAAKDVLNRKLEWDPSAIAAAEAILVPKPQRRKPRFGSIRRILKLRTRVGDLLGRTRRAPLDEDEVFQKKLPWWNNIPFTVLPRPKPLVSIVIPCYNQGRFLAATLESALSQSYSPIEVIVVNDGSSDNTEVVCRTYDDKIKYIWQPNSGVPASPRNFGIANASGKYIMCLDSDDLLHPDAISWLVEAARGREDVLCVMGYKRFVLDPSLDGEADRFPPKEGPWGPKLMLDCFGQPNQFLASRSLLNSIGGFDISRQVRGCEDWDAWIRLVFAGAEVLPIHRVGAYYRQHPNSLSKNVLAMSSAGAETRWRVLQWAKHNPKKLIEMGGDIDTIRKRTGFELFDHGFRLRQEGRYGAALMTYCRSIRCDGIASPAFAGAFKLLPHWLLYRFVRRQKVPQGY